MSATKTGPAKDAPRFSAGYLTSTPGAPTRRWVVTLGRFLDQIAVYQSMSSVTPNTVN